MPAPTGDPLPPPAARGPATPAAPVTLRPARESDLPRLTRLDEHLFPEFPYPFFVLRQLFDVHGDDLLVLDDGTDLLGYVLAGTRSDHKRSWILGLGVDARARGRGYGRQLLREALERLRREQVVEAALTVDPSNTPAVELYGSLGFVLTDERPEYFGPGQHRLIMVRSL
ncbi:N-acetyltransferase [Streptomyces sp. NPDC047072]|uniref:N-acetyltransferase n=1 Tax=Streptomyces sp. NPDC047072 TaxID=3154809 RepID=UPI0033F564F4